MKGKRRLVGKNSLSNPGHLKHSIYPKILGLHAELHVVLQASDRLKGGTLYVTGVRSTSSRNRMLNTRPCRYCRHVIETRTDINAIVYYLDGELVKEFL